jgi:opacity protein-like surface antigen
MLNRFSAGVFLVAVMVFGGPQSARAQGDDSGWYVIGGAAYQQREKAGESETTYTTFDPGFAVNGALGYEFGLVGVDGEFSYLRSQTDVVASTATGPAEGLGNVALRAYMANVRLNLAPGSPVSPYVGAGIGGYKSYLHDVSNVTAHAFGFDANGTSDGVTLAYQFRAGIGFGLGGRSEVQVGYRYLRGSELLFLGTEFGDLRPDGVRTHHLEGSVKVGF